MLCPGCDRRPAYLTKREWDYCEECRPRGHKKSDEEKAEEKERLRFIDTNMKNDDATTVLWVALKPKDLEILYAAAAKNPSVKNFAVLVRRLLAKEAKRV